MKSATLDLKGNYWFALILAVLASLLTAAALVIPAGSLDLTFGTNGVAITDVGSDSDSGGAVVLQSDGKILLSGSAQLDPDNDYHRTPFLLRYNSNGALDPSFGTNGRLITELSNFSGSRVAVLPDGKLLVAGQTDGLAVARFSASGALDTSFGTNGIASHTLSHDEYDTCVSVALQPNGASVLGGYLEIGNYAYMLLERFKSDGTADTDFDRNASDVMWGFPNNRYDYAAAVVIQGDGKIIIAGNMLDNDGVGPKITLARVNADGSPDSTFGVGGRVVTEFGDFQMGWGALALQADGKLLVAGTRDSDSSVGHPTDDIGIVRFNADGSLDTTFGGTGFVVTDFGSNERARDLAVEPGGRVVVIGTSDASGANRLLLAQYNGDGSLDTSFGTGGRVLAGDSSAIQLGAGIVVQPDGRILVAGAGNGNVALARYSATTRNATLVTVTLRSQATNDGWLLESSENSNVGGWFDKLGKTFQVGDNPKDRQSRGLLSFNTASLPDTAVITSAQVNIKKQGIVGTNPLTTHGPLLLDVRSGSFSNNLALQLSDFSAPVSPGAISEQVSLFAPEWYRATLSSGNLALINRTGMTQFRLRFTKDDNDDMSADYLKFFSGNSDLANQPQLLITYYVP